MNLLDTFLHLVQIDSPSGHEKAVGEYILSQLKPHNFQITVDQAGNIHAFRPGTGTSPLFCAHQDTIQPGENIQPILEDGIIKSSSDTILGADNKASLAAILYTVCNTPSDQTTDIELLFTVGEEAGLVGMKAFDCTTLKSTSGICFDKAAPVGTIVMQSPGSIKTQGHIKGQAAHVSNITSGKDAIATFAKAYTQLPIGKVDDDTTLNIGLLQAGENVNSVPEHLTFHADLRSHNPDALQSLHSQLINTFQSIAQQDQTTFTHQSQTLYQGYQHDKQHPHITLLQTIFESLSIPVNHVISGGASDANILNQHGILTTDLGDGSIDPHTTDERIALKDLERLSQIITQIITT